MDGNRVRLPAPKSSRLNCIPCDVVLECDNGTMEVHSQILSLSSGVLHGAISSQFSTVSPIKIKLDGSIGDWEDIICMTYPMGPSVSCHFWGTDDIPGSGLQGMLRILPLIHKYDFSFLLSTCLQELELTLPSNFSFSNRELERNVLTWLDIADSLHLDAIKDMCMVFLRRRAGTPNQKKRMLLMRAIYKTPAVAGEAIDSDVVEIADPQASGAASDIDLTAAVPVKVEAPRVSGYKRPRPASDRSGLSTAMLRLSPETRDEVLAEMLRASLTKDFLEA